MSTQETQSVQASVNELLSTDPTEFIQLSTFTFVSEDETTDQMTPNTTTITYLSEIVTTEEVMSTIEIEQATTYENDSTTSFTTYTTIAINPYAQFALGCFTDCVIDRDLPVDTQMALPVGQMNIDLCIEYCNSTGYQLAGLQHG